VLPPDGHVHTEWSWDAAAGSMERSCARAVELGLPSIAFTEHADFTGWLIAPGVRARMRQKNAARIGPGNSFRPPPLDAAAYLACVQRCRDLFPGLRILSGAELGEPHWHEAQVKALLNAGSFDRVLGSVHSLEFDGTRLVDLLFDQAQPADLIRAYLAEALRLVESTAPFAVLAHIDYPLRHWPKEAGRFDPAVFEDEYRTVLAALARSGRALEVNATVPLPPVIVRWWYESGGADLVFGSDAHEPSAVARRFADLAAAAEAAGFRPGRHPHDFWRRNPGAGRSRPRPRPGPPPSFT
jgi:histidinol-phosphatase (PHP family)